MAVAGAMPTVNGSSKAMAMDGEMPGSAPPRMPHSTPEKAATSSHSVGVLSTALKKASMLKFPSRLATARRASGC